mgnify:FL=1|tara:strand:+ start:440 stop:652 length:213 start_codon:yes stop_codon:yes gene_type:complete
MQLIQNLEKQQTTELLSQPDLEKQVRELLMEQQAQLQGLDPEAMAQNQKDYQDLQQIQDQIMTNAYRPKS